MRHELAEVVQRLTGVGGRGRLAQQRGSEAGVALAGGCERGAAAAAGAHELGPGRDDIREPEAPERGDLVRVAELVGEDRRRIERDGVRVRGRITECREQARDGGRVEREVLRVGRERRVAEPARERGLAHLVVGDGLRLQAALELEHVLGVAQPAVRGHQRGVLGVGREAGEEERVERGERAAEAKGRSLARIDELQRLHEELDLADAALAILEVEPALLARLHELPLDPAVEIAHLVEDRRRDEPREHERAKRRENLGAERGIPGARARLDPGLPLPRPAVRLVVPLGLRDGECDRPAAAFGAKPEIDAEHHIVLGDLGDRCRDLRAQLGEIFV